MGYFGSSLHPPGREIWLLSWLKGMSLGLEKPCCTKLPVAGLLQIACKVRYPANLINLL